MFLASASTGLIQYI